MKILLFALILLFSPADSPCRAPGTVEAAEPLVINEFMASNDSFSDEDGDSSDWIELCNLTEETINLDGWYLTDDPDELKKWEIPAVEIAHDGFLVVFASSKNRRGSDSELHTNFQLKAGGEFLALVRPDGQTIAHAYDPSPGNSSISPTGSVVAPAA